MWWYREGNKEQGWRGVGYLIPSIVHILVWSMCIWLRNFSSDHIVFQQVMGPHMWVAWLEVWLLVCIERDLEVLYLLEVQICTFGGFLRRFWSLGGILKSFGGALKFWSPFGVSRCTSAWLVLFGGIWKHWICMCAHSNIVSLELSHWGVFVHIWFIEHLIWVGWVHFECSRRHWCKWEPLRAEFCD